MVDIKIACEARQALSYSGTRYLNTTAHGNDGVGAILDQNSGTTGYHHYHWQPIPSKAMSDVSNRTSSTSYSGMLACWNLMHTTTTGRRS